MQTCLLYDSNQGGPQAPPFPKCSGTVSLVKDIAINAHDLEAKIQRLHLYSPACSLIALHFISYTDNYQVNGGLAYFNINTAWVGLSVVLRWWRMDRD
jgi:hypothetical protein